MFNAPDYTGMYTRFMGNLAEAVVLLVNNGTGFTSYTVQAHVSAYQSRDLVEGGPIKLGDCKLIIPADNLPTGLRRLEQKDRVQVRGRQYGIINWDDLTRSIGDTPIAVEAAARG